MSDTTRRRDFLRGLAQATGSVVLLPVVSRCGGESEPAPAPETTTGQETPQPEPQPVAAAPQPDPLAVPKVQPEDWDPIAFNRERGNAGAIPESYRDDINGPEGEAKHLGKHLPYVPEVEADKVPEGFIALMWGDPGLGYTQHPNAAPTRDNPDGHWYDWIRLRKATAGEAEELESGYSAWPSTQSGDSGRYVALEGQDPTENDGKNTVYLVAVPADVQPGDTLRVHAHCLTHGEWVDFITLPS